MLSYVCLFSPVVGSKPVEGGVQLNDVRTKENIISNLKYKEIFLCSN